MSTSIDPLVVRNTPVERRFYPRITPSVPIYVAFGPNNLGTLLNVGENGFQVVTPSRLDLNSVYRVFLSLAGISSTITVSVRTIWTADSQNSSGIQLLDLSEHDRQQIRQWVAQQTSQNENLEHWFSPKNGEPVAPAPEPPLPAAAEFSAPRPEPPPSAVPEPLPMVVESATKPEFPPMPLPIHGEFTYEPPSDREKKILLRRERASRFRSRSPISMLILWTLFMSAICVAAGWSFRHKLADAFLRRSTQVAKESSQPPDTPPLVAPDAPALPTGEATSGTKVIDGVKGQANADGSDVANPDHAATASSIAPAQTAAPKPFPPAAVIVKRIAAKVSASKPNLGSLPIHSTQPEAPEVSRPYVADSAPPLIPTNGASPVRVPASAMSVSNANAPAPALKTNTAPALQSQPATIRSTVDAPASRRSAIAGSISNSSGPSDSFVARPSDTAAASAPPVSPQPATSRANSFAARNANPGYSSPANPAPANPAVIQMDVPEARVIEVTPPRSLTGNLTASFVNLPGERVLRSASLTIHIARSVQVPGERIPGQRWLWRGHKKVVLGELASRVDPQASSLSVPYGSITVLATIDREGYVSNVKPLYGSLAFLPNVAAAVRDWRYQPTYLDNKPVDTQAQIEIDFHSPATRASRP
jgi:PilZ domain/Gram-negative bacterial TonB protein C-terminal